MDDPNYYSITWAYIVKKMEEDFGVPPDSEELFAFGDLVRFVNYIWDKYSGEKYEKEKEKIYKWATVT